MSKRLTDRQQKFVELYTGNATEAAKLAGYSTPKTAGKRCLENVHICTLIKEKRDKECKPHVLSRIERQEYWSDVIRDTDESTANRLKASELLGKSEGDFITKHAMDDSMQTGLSGLIDRIQSKQRETGK